MSTKPSFPQPFSAGDSKPAQDAAGTPEQRPIYPAQCSAYPPEIRSPPNLMPTPNVPPRHPSTYIPAYQPIQGPVRTHPAFPIPQVQDTRVPTTHSFPPPPMMLTGGTTCMPSHLHNTQDGSRPYLNYPPQAPVMSHSLSQRGSGMLGALHVDPRVQRNRAWNP
ncbi:hypothetical protein BJY52DRAFT_1192020 [Lactarius psammicola]|nr:hypothetical protein BJY52DRAFT_1192020 [Lactarius psammicola]